MAWSLKNLFQRRSGPATPQPLPATDASPANLTPTPPAPAEGPLSAESWFQRGNGHASTRQWPAALDCYRQAIRLDSQHAPAHTFEGNVLLQLGQRSEAAESYGRAIAANATLVEPRYNRGVVYLQLGQPARALDDFQGALSLSPGMAEAHCGRADALIALGRSEEALAAYEAAIASNGAFLNAFLRRGMLQQQLQRREPAAHSYRQALSLRPQHAETHFRLGTLQREDADMKAALASFDQAITLDPGHAGAHSERGAALLSLGKASEALLAFDTALRLQPGQARVMSLRAQAFEKVGLVAKARAEHDQAAMLAPADAEILFNRGSFLGDQKDYAQALRAFESALAVRPNYAEAHAGMGVVQQEAGDLDGALASYSRALTLQPRLSVALNNRGNIRRTRRLLPEAMQDYRDALAIDPGFADAHYNLGQLALLQGDFGTGWREYEWRSAIKESLAASPRSHSQPRWHGESLQGKRLFIHAEQGLGDTIQFCRYARTVANLGAVVVLEVQPPLRELLTGLDGVSTLIAQGDSVPPTDFECPLMSLPGVCGTSLDTIPSPGAYLHADPVRLARWQTALGAKTRPRIGLAWSGNPRHSNDGQRSLALSEWAPYLPDGFDYICVQNQVRESDQPALRSLGIRTFDADMAETAALMLQLDLVISVDTSLAHLSGALGQKTWILLSFLPDWRWLLDRDDTPWYPTATLYRQATPGDWGSALAQVKESLLQLLP